MVNDRNAGGGESFRPHILIRSPYQKMGSKPKQHPPRKEVLMKTKSTRCQFQLKILYGQVHYIDRIRKLEAAIRRKPRTLQINIIGRGEIAPDYALLMRSILLK